MCAGVAVVLFGIPLGVTASSEHAREAQCHQLAHLTGRTTRWVEDEVFDTYCVIEVEDEWIKTHSWEPYAPD